jgi:hypothetical protein
MKAYWLTGKKGAEQPSDEAKPLDDGRFCRVTDLEDGSQAVRTYGKTPDEVYGKIEKTSMHARAHLASPARQPAGPIPATVKPAPTRRLTLTADEQMLATSELTNPAKAPGAIVKLFENATGIDTEQIAARGFEATAIAWAATHPELKDVPYNKKLIFDNARSRTGNIRLITAEILEQCFQELKQGGYLLTEEDLPDGIQPPALPVLPAQNPDSRTRQTDAAFATSHRINRTGSTQLPQWKPKWTREEFDKMPLKESDRLLRARDRDYIEAANYHYPPRQARA